MNRFINLVSCWDAPSATPDPAGITAAGRVGQGPEAGGCPARRGCASCGLQRTPRPIAGGEPRLPLTGANSRRRSPRSLQAPAQCACVPGNPRACAARTGRQEDRLTRLSSARSLDMSSMDCSRLSVAAHRLRGRRHRGWRLRRDRDADADLDLGGEISRTGGPLRAREQHDLATLCIRWSKTRRVL